MKFLASLIGAFLSAFLISMMLLSMAPAAQAVNWHQVATTADGQQSQSVDIDSIERSPQGVRLKSAWENRTTRSVTTYLTEYDCKHQRYRDLVENGQPTKGEWKPLVGDPLNYATMKYACDRY